MAEVGFIGLGTMGQPMALNLARAGTPLVVWNRSVGRTAPVRDAGAAGAASAEEVFARCATVILMLADGAAIDAVLGRGTDAFATMVRGRTIVQMGTVSAEYSLALCRDLAEAGASYVEAPVSGSRAPAEAGALIAMLAGDAVILPEIGRLIAPMCAAVFECGAVPAALTMKFAVNVFLMTQIAGLAEAFHFAEAQGLDVALLESIIDAGPLASAVSRVRADKIVRADYSVHTSLVDVRKNAGLVTAAARHAGVAVPLMAECERLYGEAVDAGHGGDDMAGVIRALRARTAAL